MPDDESRPGPTPLDRFGRAVGEMASVAAGMWDRNQKLLGSVSDHLRSPNYTADHMADDAAKAIAAAMDNLEDLWTSLTRMPELEEVATPLPSVFLLLRRQAGVDPPWAIAGPAWIRLPRRELDALENKAEIVFTNSPSADAAKALRHALRVTKQEGRGYKIEVVRHKGVEPGFYRGDIFVAGKYPRALADLRIVVEGGD
jgi:hypothetical protein